LRQFFPVNRTPDTGFLFRKPEQTSPANGIEGVNIEVECTGNVETGKVEVMLCKALSQSAKRHIKPYKEKTMAKDKAMTNVFFKPWVGENYKAKGFNWGNIPI
jgi:hypothetical protein